jgi:diguanylate cyclase (GGDEF)-like protein
LELGAEWLQNDEIIGILGIYEDITKRKEAEKRNRYLANYDSLTNLPNRAYLDTQFRYILNVAKRERENIVIALLDLDHFKDINDTLGHNIGDMLLKEFAKRLQTLLREIDIVSRLGAMSL